MHKLLEIRKEERRTVYLLDRQVATLKDRAIMVDSLKYVTVREPVHVSAARRKDPSKGLAGKEMTQHHFWTHQLAWPARTTRPSISYEVRNLQRRTSQATASDLVLENFVLRAAPGKTKQAHGLCFRKTDVGLACKHVHDVGFGKQPRCGSQHGLFTVLTNTDIFTDEAPIRFEDWCSCQIHNKMRSTLATEAIKTCEGHDQYTWIRALTA